MMPSIPGPAESVSLVEVLGTRRTIRRFARQPLSREQLLALLWSAQGVTGEAGKKTVPSAGAVYPVRLYVAASLVAGVGSGLYAFDPDQSSLELVAERDIRSALRAAALEEQPWVGDAAAVIIVVSDMEKMTDHFGTQPPIGKRGARYAYIETGALAQNVQLLATAMNLGVVLVGGFDDETLKALLQLSLGFEVTALLCVGIPDATA